MRKSIATLAVFSLCAVPALAAEGKTIFSCIAVDGKAITVQKIKDDYQLSYGKITVKNSVKQVINNEGSYIARGSSFITNSLAFQGKNVSYKIQFVQTHNGQLADTPMLYIEKGEVFNQVECDVKKKIVHNFEQNIMNSL